MTTSPAEIEQIPETTTLSFSEHLLRTLKLAAPVVVARAGLLVMAAVDTAMLGHYRTIELAYYAAANALQIVMILVGVGLLQGTVIMVAQARGAGEDSDCGQYWRIGLIHGAVLGIIMGALCLAGQPLLRLIGQAPELVSGGGDVMRMISWGFPGLMMWVATSFFMEGLSRPLPGMLLMLGAVFLNAGLNVVFIYGHLGVPELGAEGAAIATSIVRWAMFAVLAIYVLNLRDGAKLGITGRIRDAWSAAKKLRRIGYPLGAARGLEAGAFSALTMLAGLLGTVPLAAYQIALNLIAMVFMCAIGTAAASTIRVGNAVGRMNMLDIRRAGWAGVIIIICAMLAFGGVFLGLSSSLAKIYSDDVAVIPIAAAMIAIGGIALVFDGAQAVLMGALRGIADVWIPPLMQLIAWWGVAVTGAYLFSHVLGLGAVGLMWGFLAGTVVSSLLLAFRFLTVSHRPAKRY